MNVSGMTSPEVKLKKIDKWRILWSYGSGSSLITNLPFWEVNRPGWFLFEQSISLLNAIGLAGDLTYSGLGRCADYKRSWW
jgi:hypothetical protein